VATGVDQGGQLGRDASERIGDGRSRRRFAVDATLEVGEPVAHLDPRRAAVEGDVDENRQDPVRILVPEQVEQRVRAEIGRGQRRRKHHISSGR
jgi:hypothetical protein